MTHVNMNAMPFQRRGNFLGVDDHHDQPFVVLGVPFDCATTFRPGARLAPQAVRQASLMLADGTHPQWDVDLHNWLGDGGDLHITTGNTVQAHAQIYDQVQPWVSSHHVLSVGGDHSISLPLMRAHHTHHGRMAVVHLDAHCDTWSDHFGEPYGHGTWVRDVIGENLADPQRFVSLGVRSAVDSNTRDWLQNQGGTTFTAQQLYDVPPHLAAAWVQSIVGDQPCYLSMDIDCLDPAHAPGTGTPEVAGLSMIWLQMFLGQLLGAQASPTNFVGMDMVEVSPPYDHSQITSLAAATIMWQYVSARAWYKNPPI